MRTARCSPGTIRTSSIAAADSEWMFGRLVSNDDARAAVLHVERVGDAHDAGLERQRPPALAVADDRVQDLARRSTVRSGSS